MSYKIKGLITGSIRSINPVEPVAAVPYYINRNGAGSPVCAIPSHQVGDLIIAIAWNTTAPMPSYPSGNWVPLSTFTSGSVRSAAAYLVSDGTAASVTFSNAVTTTVKIYRGCDVTTPVQTHAGWAFYDGTIIQHVGMGSTSPDALITSSSYNLTVASSIFTTQSPPGTTIRYSSTALQVVDTTTPVSSLANYQAGSSSPSYKVSWSFALKGLIS